MRGCNKFSQKKSYILYVYIRVHGVSTAVDSLAKSGYENIVDGKWAAYLRSDALPKSNILHAQE